MPHRYVVTFIGDDRTGIVEQLASNIERVGGNWLESQLSQLEGKFAGLILIDLNPDSASTLESALAELPGGNWSVRVTPAGNSSASQDCNLALTIVGPDRPGIVREVSRALADAAISVVTMESRVASAPFTGEPIFHASINACHADNVTLPELEARLDAIADAMTLDIDIAY